MSLSGGLPRQRANVKQLRADEECVLCDADGHVLCGLNETASALWDLCDGHTRPDEIVDAICLACDEDRAVVELDVVRALLEFTEAGLIEWVEP